VSHTFKNLREVEDAAAEHGLSDFQEARFATGDLDSERTGVALISVKPGQRQPFAHYHDEAEEIYVVIRGSGRIRLDDEIVELGELDAIRIAPSVMRKMEAGPDGLEVLAFGPHHERDGGIDKDFWTD
jgi:mannose-6-phosphate isomerase-like protein (cupin superfamily)